MYLQKTKRSPFYQLVYFKDGRRRTISTRERTKAGAQQFLIEFKKSLEEKQISKKLSIEDFRDEYESYIEGSKSKSYLKSVQLSFRQLLQFVGNIYLSELTQQRFEQFIISKYSESKHASVLYYRTLKAAFNKAVEWEMLKSNPLSKIKTPKTPKTHPVFITEGQLQIIINETKEKLLKELFVLAFHTGMRAGELVNLKWKAVDLQGKKVTVMNDGAFSTKSNKDRVIPLNKKAVNALKSIRRCFKNVDAFEYIFLRKGYIKFTEDYISKKFKIAAMLSLNNEKIHFHTLRHSFASNMVQKGVSIYVVKELMGHSSITTTQIYSHLNIDSMRKAVNMLE